MLGCAQRNTVVARSIVVRTLLLLQEEKGARVFVEWWNSIQIDFLIAYLVKNLDLAYALDGWIVDHSVKCMDLFMYGVWALPW